MKNLTTNKTNGAAKGKMRKAFTLIEIIFVVVIIAIMAGLTIPKIIKNSEITQVTSAVQDGMKNIATAEAQYAKDNSNQSGGSTAILDYMPTFEAGGSDGDGYQFIQDKNYPTISYGINSKAGGLVDLRIRYDSECGNNQELCTFEGQRISKIAQKYCKNGTLDTSHEKDGIITITDCSFQ